MSRHLISIRELRKDQIEELLELASVYKRGVKEGKAMPTMDKKSIGLLFFENSTRTRVSFEQACYYLGLRTSSFAAGGSSMSKGETLKDTILTLRYERLDGLVMRHRASGASTLATRYFGGPVLNAGDGQHEHPTQALGDALTIAERKGKIKGLRVAIVGDVEHSRVARSNAWLLSKLGAEVRFIGPKMLLPSNCAKLPGIPHTDLATGLEDADVVICLRLQKERMTDGMITSVGEYTRLYQVNKEALLFASKDCLVMHPGPLNRGIEVDDVAADGDASAIHQQVENGIFVRMAALTWCFGDEPARPRAKSVPAAKAPAKSKPRAKSKVKA
ncbi:MAG: Aspartate carbamoyltransferase [Fimbriimonadaceae bacterium]|nr:Aspartate carbamoyltransferase [Fimbriimonadaceae bacterium]